MSAVAQRDALALEAVLAPTRIVRTARILSPREARVALRQYARERARATERRLLAVEMRESLGEAAARRCSTLDLADAPPGGVPDVLEEAHRLAPRFRGIVEDEGITVEEVADLSRVAAAMAERERRLRANGIDPRRCA